MNIFNYREESVKNIQRRNFYRNMEQISLSVDKGWQLYWCWFFKSICFIIYLFILIIGGWRWYCVAAWRRRRMRQRWWWWRCRRCCWWCTIKHFAIDNIAMFVFGFEATWTWYGEIPPLMTVLATFLLFVKDAIQIVYGFMSGHSVAHNIVSRSVQFKWVQFKWDRFRGAPKNGPSWKFLFFNL